jgi:hypothetical protein
MACKDAPCSPVSSAEVTPTVYSENIKSGNAVSNIPVKIGEALSTSNQRASIIGAIPEVIRYAGFTLVGGAPSVTKASNGGFADGAALARFLNNGTYNQGVFNNIPLMGSTCK